MNIINFKNLARNPLRRKALLIAEAGYQAIEIKKVISKKIKFQNGKLFIKSAMTRHSAESCSEFDLSVYKRVSLIGIGKGSALACIALAKILDSRLTDGIALDVNKNLKSQISNLKIFIGTHPLPSKQNVKATRKIIELVRNLKKDDLLITFICGGGSALLCGSEKEMNDSILTTKLLTQAGANILELNTIRKHLSEIKGGGLAKIAYPATVISLIISDVLGNNLSMVASGPTVCDKTTKKDAIKILNKYNPQPTTYNLQFIETPKDKKYFKKVNNILFVCNQDAVVVMAEKAKKLGFNAKIYSVVLRGEASMALLPMMAKVKKNEALIAAGETTVTLKNQESGSRNYGIGKGGRNMESVLGAINSLPNSCFIIHNSVILSIASDGRDNTEAAGAIGDILTIKKAEKLKLNPQEFLEHHDSFNFFKKTGDLVFTKPKTFNVADLMLVLSASKE